MRQPAVSRRSVVSSYLAFGALGFAAILLVGCITRVDQPTSSTRVPTSAPTVGYRAVDLPGASLQVPEGFSVFWGPDFRASDGQTQIPEQIVASVRTAWGGNPSSILAIRMEAGIPALIVVNGTIPNRPTTLQSALDGEVDQAKGILADWESSTVLFGPYEAGRLTARLKGTNSVVYRQILHVMLIDGTMWKVLYQYPENNEYDHEGEIDRIGESLSVTRTERGNDQRNGSGLLMIIGVVLLVFAGAAGWLWRRFRKAEPPRVS